MSYRRKHIQPKIKSLKRGVKIIQRPFFWIILLIFILVGTASYFALFFPKFQVSTIVVLGNEKVESKDIEGVIWNYLNKELFDVGIFNISSKSIFFVNRKSLTKNILSNFPQIQNVQIKKNLTSSLILKIEERQPFAVFCQNNDCFFIDVNGVIFEPLQNKSPDMVITMSDYKDIFVGENIIAERIMDMISKVKDNLKNNFQIDIKEALVSSPEANSSLAENPLVFKTSENWQIYFNPESDIDLQITKMNSLLESEITVDERKNLQYIYLQYKDRAYYK